MGQLINRMDQNLWTLAKTSAVLKEEVRGRIHVLVFNAAGWKNIHCTVIFPKLSMLEFWNKVCMESKTKFTVYNVCWGQLASMVIVIICLSPQYISWRKGCKISTYRLLCLLQLSLPLLSLFSCISLGQPCFLLPSGTHIHVTVTCRALIHEYLLMIVTHCEGVQSFTFPLFCSS